MRNNLKNTNIKFEKKIEVNGEIRSYYVNVLKSLGLSDYYIYKNNFIYFGYQNIYDQDKILQKFKKIENDFELFIEYLLGKYNCTVLLLQFTNIYSKLQDIHFNNDYVLGNIGKNANFESISYSSKAADIMARKIKPFIEKVLIRQNNNGCSCFTKTNYNRLIILLYYYSIYIFYNVRSNLSKQYENGVTKFWIDPKSLSPVYTQIDGQDNSTNDNMLFYNYNSNKKQIIDSEFNEAFFKEKGILFVDFMNLMNGLLNFLGKKNSGIISDSQLNNYIKKTFPSCNLDIFRKECILRNNSFEVDENNLYKSSCKHRLDTIPIIYFEDDKYLISKGIILNSINIWKNAQFIGLKPYNTPKDDILKSIDNIIHKISISLENDIVDILKRINSQFNIYRNRKTKHIFKGLNIEGNEWDIIAVDYKYKYIFDIESKFLSTSMTESSLSNDLRKLEGYKKSFEKRIDIEENNMKEFLKFCNANNKFKIIHIMVTSKVVDSNIISDSRRFAIIHYEGLEKYIMKNYYSAKK